MTEAPPDPPYGQVSPDACPPCLVCGRELGTVLMPPGIVLHGSPGYGSRFDDTLRASELLRLAVCDDCLAARPQAVQRVRTERTETRTAAPWSPQYDRRKGDDKA